MTGRWWATVVLALIVAAGLPAAGRAAEGNPDGGLWSYIAKIRPDFHIGFYFPEDPVANRQAAAFATGNVNFVTVGTYMKVLQPDPGRWHFDKLDARIGFFRQAGVGVALHHGIGWNTYNPDWFVGGGYDRDRLAPILDDRIRTLLTRYRDQVWLFHVVNEAFDRDGRWRADRYNAWMGLGWHRGRDGEWPAYIEAAFRAARAYGGPTVQLIYTDNNNAMPNSIKSDATYTLFRALRGAGVPIDGVGFQFHTAIRGGVLREGSNGEGVAVDFDGFIRNIRRFAQAGAAVHVTEFDVHLDPTPTSADDAIQAWAYREALRRCLEEPACKSFNSWGSSDHNWGPAGSGGRSPHAMMLDEAYRPKSAYRAMLAYVQGRLGTQQGR